MSPNWRLTTASGRRIVARTSTLILAIVTISSRGTHARSSEVGRSRLPRPIGYATTDVPIFLLATAMCCAIEQAIPCALRTALPQTKLREDRLPLDAIEALTTRASPLALAEPAPDAGALAAMLARRRARRRTTGKSKLHGASSSSRREARNAFGDVLARRAAQARAGVCPRSAIDKERGKPLQAPSDRRRRRRGCARQQERARRASRSWRRAPPRRISWWPRMRLGFRRFLAHRQRRLRRRRQRRHWASMRAMRSSDSSIWARRRCPPRRPPASSHAAQVAHWTGPPDHDAGPWSAPTILSYRPTAARSPSDRISAETNAREDSRCRGLAGGAVH